MSDFVISGLIRRRRELTGDMLELLSKVDVLAADVAAIDKVLGMFAPDMIPQAIPALQIRPKPDWAMRGEVSRIVMALLRASPEPLSTAQIAAEIHTRRGLEGEITRLHLKRVRKCLDRQRVRGVLEAVPVGGVLVWGLT
jgi:hypothetical protein